MKTWKHGSLSLTLKPCVANQVLSTLIIFKSDGPLSLSGCHKCCPSVLHFNVPGHAALSFQKNDHAVFLWERLRHVANAGVCGGSSWDEAIELQLLIQDVDSEFTLSVLWYDRYVNTESISKAQK